MELLWIIHGNKALRDNAKVPNHICRRLHNPGESTAYKRQKVFFETHKGSRAKFSTWMQHLADAGAIGLAYASIPRLKTFAAKSKKTDPVLYQQIETAFLNLHGNVFSAIFPDCIIPYRTYRHKLKTRGPKDATHYYWKRKVCPCNVKIIKCNMNLQKKRLTKALMEIRLFASKTKQLNRWCEWFDTALATLDGNPVKTDSRDIYIREMLEGSGISSVATKLLIASFQAKVFGGMSSWNDVSLPTSKYDEYDRVSDNLSKSILASEIAAANSTLKK
ncbi:hypothetical protein ACFL54_09740 [Planctomycetota bacterium]